MRVQNSLHAFGHVHRGQRGAGNVADVGAHFERTAAGLADELPEPARASDLAAIGLAILQNVDAVIVTSTNEVLVTPRLKIRLELLTAPTDAP